MEDSLTTVQFKKDSFIMFEETQKADRFYIIREGKVKISREVNLGAREDNLLGPGDYFGVICAMSSQRHIETAQALTDVDLIVVYREQYGNLIQKNSQIAMKIIMQFSKRLRYLNKAVAGIALKKNVDLTTAHLFEVGEYYFKQKQNDIALHTYIRYIKHCPDGINVNAAKSRIIELNTRMKGAARTEKEFGPNEVNRTYSKGALIFVEGEPGDELFIIQEGSVKITRIVSDNEVLLIIVKAGEIFGEMALLENKPRSATAVAFEDCKVMTMSRANFSQMIATQPRLIAKVTTLLAERLWLIYKQLINTLIENPTARLYDILVIQLEKEHVSLNSKSPHTFDFGQQELINMAGIPEREANEAMELLFKSKLVRIHGDKVFLTSVVEVFKQAASFKKKDMMEKARKM